MGVGNVVEEVVQEAVAPVDGGECTTQPVPLVASKVRQRRVPARALGLGGGISNAHHPVQLKRLIAFCTVGPRRVAGHPSGIFKDRMAQAAYKCGVQWPRTWSECMSCNGINAASSWVTTNEQLAYYDPRKQVLDNWKQDPATA